LITDFFGNQCIDFELPLAPCILTHVRAKPSRFKPTATLSSKALFGDGEGKELLVI
jgi:hypothetical protein